jgi:hypothetical protein
MIVFMLLAVALAVPTLVGFVRIRRQRRVDRRHFAAFIGFSAAVLAIAILIVKLTNQWWLGPVKSRYISDASMDVIAVSSIILHLSTLVAFSSGFFSTGLWQTFLIVFGPVMFLMYVLLAFSNFGA